MGGLLRKIDQGKFLHLAWHPRWRRVASLGSGWGILPRTRREKRGKASGADQLQGGWVGRASPGCERSVNTSNGAVMSLPSLRPHEERTVHASVCHGAWGGGGGGEEKVLQEMGGDWTFVCFVQNAPILLRCASSSTPVLLNIDFFHYYHPSCPRKKLF